MTIGLFQSIHFSFNHPIYVPENKVVTLFPLLNSKHWFFVFSLLYFTYVTCNVLRLITPSGNTNFCNHLYRKSSTPTGGVGNLNEKFIKTTTTPIRENLPYKRENLIKMYLQMKLSTSYDFMSVKST